MTLAQLVSWVRRFEQALLVLFVVVSLYFYMLRRGYRLRKVDSDPFKHTYIRSNSFRCVRKYYEMGTTAVDGSGSLRVRRGGGAEMHWFQPQDLQLVPGVRFKLYIIVHDDRSQYIAETWSQCAPWAEILRIPSNTPFFESTVYNMLLQSRAAQLQQWRDYDFIGLATYKTLKMTSIEKLKAYLELAQAKNYDVVPLLPAGEYLLQQAFKGHGAGFSMRWKHLLMALDFSNAEIDRHSDIEVFLRNTYIAKPAWLLRVAQFMKYAIDTYHTRNDLQQLFRKNAHYREAKPHVAKHVFGKKYYEWHPFVFERLPCFFFHAANASVFSTLREVTLFDNAQTDTLFQGL